MNPKEKSRDRTEDSCRRAVAAADLFAAPRVKVFLALVGDVSFVAAILQFARETGIDFLHMPAHQKFHHGRHNGAGEKIGGEHGEDHRRSQWLKQISGGATKEKDRHKHDANAECRNKRGHGDLHGAVENRADHRFSHGEVAMDVLNLNRGVIHENAYSERQTAEGHDVQCLAQCAKDDDRAQDRQRNRRRDDQCAAPVAQKKQNHQRSQARGDHAFAQNTVNRGADENRLVEKLADLQFLWERGLNTGQRVFDALDDVEGRCTGAFQDREQR